MTDKAALADLRQRNYAHYLALWLVPAVKREFAVALFALEAELQAVPTKVTEPMLGLMRIIWWRDAVAEGAQKSHPLLQALRPYLTDAGPVGAWIETFDLPFLPVEEQPARLEARYTAEIELLGQAAGKFLSKVRKSPNQKPVNLIIQVVKLNFWHK